MEWTCKFSRPKGGEDEIKDLFESGSHGWVQILIKLPLPILHLMPSLTKAYEAWMLCHVKLGLCPRGASKKPPLGKY